MTVHMKRRKEDTTRQSRLFMEKGVHKLQQDELDCSREKQPHAALRNFRLFTWKVEKKLKIWTVRVRTKLKLLKDNYDSQR